MSKRMGRVLVGETAADIKGLTEGSILFPHSSQLGQRWPSDSRPLQGNIGFYFFGVLTSFFKNKEQLLLL